MRKIFFIVSFIIFIFASYWGSAKYASASLQKAFAEGDIQAIDRLYNWDNIAHNIGKKVATSFQDESAVNLGSLVEKSFRAKYLSDHRKKQVMDVVSEGFTNIDEYTIELKSGNRIELVRHGVKWIVNNIDLTLNHTKLTGILELSSHQSDAIPNIHNGDIYYGDSSYGCRLTNSGDITTLRIILRKSDPRVRIAFLRTPNKDDESLSQIWSMDFPSLNQELIFDKKTAGNDNNYPSSYNQTLESSPDGNYLYFNTAKWAVSDAIISINVKTKSPKMLSPGNGLYVIKKGKYIGNIITSKHKYDDKGSYDWIYVIDVKNGKEITSSGKNIDFNEYINFIENS